MLQECKHTFCKACFKEYYRSLIEDQNKHHDLRCPENKCATKPTEEEVRAIINDDSFRKFKKFQTNTKVAQDKHLLFCSTPDCGQVLNDENAVKKLVWCNKCHQNTCIKCKMPGHGKVTCEKNMEKKYNMATLGVDVHSCP